MKSLIRSRHRDACRFQAQQQALKAAKKEAKIAEQQAEKAAQNEAIAPEILRVTMPEIEVARPAEKTAHVKAEKAIEKEKGRR